MIIYLLSSVHFTRMRWEFGAKITVSILVAIAIYFVVELPFLRWKDRLHGRAAPAFSVD
jgi:peptidoglycan/LPS O-acetylase OafA/YrhL